MTADDCRAVQRWYRAHARTHAIVLRWYRSVGYARCAGVSVDMFEPPAIGGSDIEFIPGVATRIDGRDMTPEEAAAVRRMLEQMAQDARDALAGQSTLVVSVQARRP